MFDEINLPLQSSCLLPPSTTTTLSTTSTDSTTTTPDFHFFNQTQYLNLTQNNYNLTLTITISISCLIIIILTVVAYFCYNNNNCLNILNHFSNLRQLLSLPGPSISPLPSQQSSPKPSIRLNNIKRPTVPPPPPPHTIININPESPNNIMATV
jgi:hypothetical protein